MPNGNVPRRVAVCAVVNERTPTDAVPLVARAEPRLTRTQVAWAILALATGGFAIGVTEFAIMGLQREIVLELGISYGQGGMLVTAYALGVMVGAPVLSLMGAKRERRSYAIFLLALFMAAHVLSYFAQSFETLLVSRFLSGLPHGAFFATAALMAAQMAGPAKRGRAIAVVLSGLAIANVSGVPAVTWVGQQFGWRWMFLIVAGLAGFTMLAVALLAPKQAAPAGASVTGELKALANQRLWVGIGLAIIGFSGMFAIYTYLAHVAVEVTGFSDSMLPWVVLIFGSGMVVGTFVGGFGTDRSVLGTVLAAMVLVAVFMALFAVFAHIPWLMLILLFCVGVSASCLSPSMQTHLIDTAPKAPQLAASFHHSAFNAANALGAVAGGLTIDMGLGLRAPAYAGAAAAAVGVALTLYAIWLTKRAGQKI